jgi:hypothetical protein
MTCGIALFEAIATDHLFLFTVLFLFLDGLDYLQFLLSLLLTPGEVQFYG